MDTDKEPRAEGEEQTGLHRNTGDSSSLSGTAESLHRSGVDSQGPSAGTDADADLLSSDMDGAGEGYRRRRARLMKGLEHENMRRKSSGKKHVHRHRNVPGASDEENKQLMYSSDEGHGSDFSSRTTSEDFELDRLTAEDVFSDDTEAGMTKKDQKNRKRRRRKAIRMDERFAGNVKASRPNHKFSYSAIYTAWLVNALLVASWYAFSLSISIVSGQNSPSDPVSADSFSVQQMDVLAQISRFSFPSLHYMPAYARPVLLSQHGPLFRTPIASSDR